MQQINESNWPKKLTHFEGNFKSIAQSHTKPNAILRAWLLNQSSLTTKLQNHFGDFQVEVVSECWINNSQAKQFFRQALKNKQFKIDRLWCRKVNLKCNGNIVVRAHTLVPLQTFHNQTRRIGKLQNKSLGHFLFTHKHIQRQPITILNVEKSHWARQSIFNIYGYPLLVTEFFEPDFLNKNQK
ncbi:chorismate--pyruvate lyase family protein [Marinicellulosiphila megalodicopiae]|uniref:chorismate--pyruvate lyase family protein n=1 Tax=Marinicellulosiphila megalodicopiae TaxID=2724896 RepID=UPI003BB1A243